MRRVLCLVTVTLLAASMWESNDTASAQVRRGRIGRRGGIAVGRWYQPYGVYGIGYGGYGGYGWGYGGSTVAEGYGRGMADVIRAQAEYNQADAQARLTREEARARYIENKKKAADTYWEMKENHRQYKEEQRRAQEERAARGRAKLEASQTSSKMQGLGPDDFDPVTGKIHWPELLQQPEFDATRAKLNDLFEHRTLTGGAAGEENSDDIEAATDAMRAELKKQIRSVPAMEYMAARKFIDGLAYEGRG